MASTTTSSNSTSNNSKRMMMDREISPNLSPVLPTMLPFVVGGICAMNAVYSLLVSFFRNPTTLEMLGVPPPAAEFCQNQTLEECQRPDLLAFQVISGLTFFTCGSIGIYSWHVTRRAQAAQTAEARLYTVLPEAKWLAAVNLTYQVWDFYISFKSIPEFCTAIMMTHHVVAAVVAYSALKTQVLGHYAIFFLGLSEVSSIFLVVCDLSRFFPPIEGTMYFTIVNSICAPLFVVCFIYYRVVLWWWPLTWQLYLDTKTVTKNGMAEKLRPGCTWVLYEFLLLDVPMGFLQLYWFGLIIQIVYSKLSGESQ